MTRTVLAALLFSFALGCGPGGAKDYNEGVRLMQAKNYGASIPKFEGAIASNANFSEAWYNLGTARMRQAIKLADQKKDKEAIQMFRRGIEDKRKARELMDRGKFVVYKDEPAQQNDIKKKLANFFKVISPLTKDDASLLTALKLLKRMYGN